MKVFAFIIVTAALLAISPDEAYTRLVKGNARFVEDMAKRPDQGEKRRLAITDKQEPFAVIVACSDSRVAPEIIFDQGLGDLFVIRVAGNIVGPFEMSSIFYAVKHLHSSIIVVVGHQNCGAVDATLTNNTDDIPFIARLIQPAIEKAQKKSSKKGILENSIKFNATNMANFIANFPTIRPFATGNQVSVKPAYYDMTSGKVTFLHPQL